MNSNTSSSDVERERDVYRALFEFTLSNDPGGLLEYALETIRSFTGADYVFLRLYRWETEPRVGTSPAPARTAETISRSVIRDALNEGRSFRVDFAAKDPEHRHRDSVQRHSIGALLVVPVDRHGAIYLESHQPGRFTPTHEGAVKALAAALAPYAARVVADPLLGPTTDEGEAGRDSNPVQLRRDLGLPGRSEWLQTIRNRVAGYANSKLIFYLTGPPGSGKSELAAFIHRQSERARKRLLMVNCATLPNNLFESEVFGHMRGAFSGAIVDHPGLLEQANGGTLFLDEIGEMPLECQAKLLTAIEHGTFRRLGDERVRTVDVRFICATNRDLDQSAGKSFRTDLLHRLRQIPLFLPPLIERPEDIGELCYAILRRERGDTAPDLTRDALALLQQQPWPGNIRQLALVLRLALQDTGAGGFLRSEDIRRALLVQGGGRALTDRAESLDTALEQYERQYIISTLEKNGGNVSRTAVALGRERTALQKRMKRLGISGLDPSPHPPCPPLATAPGAVG